MKPKAPTTGKGRKGLYIAMAVFAILIVAVVANG